MVNWDSINHFQPKEFQDPDVPGSGEFIDPVLVTVLDGMREYAGWEVKIHWEVGGAVDVNGTHDHAENSFHLKENGCKAVDFHFITTADPRLQYQKVERGGFTGIGIYYHWHWDGELLPIAFHVDFRPLSRYQRWTEYEKGKRSYWLK